MKWKNTALIALLTGGLLCGAATTGTAAAPLHTEEAACELTGGQLTWGLKESFRSYISGGIAKGSWETSEGAGYTTPNFEFGAGGGTATAAAGVSYSMPGTVHFTGHDGVLDLTLANPTLRVLSEDRGVLLLDMRSTDTSGQLKVDAAQVNAVDINLSGALQLSDGELTITAAPATLAEGGVDGFGGFYSAGEQLDPITFVAKAPAGCLTTALGITQEVADAPTDSGEQATQTPQVQEPAAGSSSEIPWLPIGIGAAALLVIGVTGGILIAGRNRQRGASASQAQ